ncbi:MAG: aldose 1-epimerase family protein [Microlunatus sp.]|nr:aldose 1-epimerase family protein [Microlunatus sp.]MDN5770503.1 aldose 1-epimerase family protein [Microlunatus sp.]MDN5805198.1 aldose 1-epimerase family protein [Microlunatus sp.]
MSNGAVHPTGDQYEIAQGDRTAVITEVGATLRSYAVAGHDVVRGFAAEDVVHGGHGQQLLPWPNRIRDGRYAFEGKTQQLSLSEPERHNAIHGLVRNVPWRLVEHTADRVEQRVRVYPQSGWPGIIEATIVHTVGDDGVVTEVEVTNIGHGSVPFGYAAHPYLTVGEHTVDDVVISAPAERYLEVDERLLPVDLVLVEGRPEDLRTAAVLGDRHFDTALTGLARGDDGRWRSRLKRGERWAELWAGPGLDWMQVFTGNDRRDLSIAVEPMTCGPNAFNPGPTHDGMIVLEPGVTVSYVWGIDGA